MYGYIHLKVALYLCTFISSDAKRHMREDMYYELQSKEIAKQEGGCVREVEQGCFKKADTIKELAN